jgi:hypothetical protein
VGLVRERRLRARRFAVLAACALAAAATAPPPVRAAGDPQIHARAFEAGLAAATSTVEGNTQGALFVRAGTFAGAPRGLASFHLELSYSHVRSLDELGLEASAGWSSRRGPILPFVAAAFGVRQEWIGSFREARLPVGVDAGVRLLFSPRVGLRSEYRFRRVLGDPVSDFGEHRFVTGLSVFWNNEG